MQHGVGWLILQTTKLCDMTKNTQNIAWKKDKIEKQQTWHIIICIKYKKLDKKKSNKEKKLYQHNKERDMKKTKCNLYEWGNN
jgi:hypothetical protein